MMVVFMLLFSSPVFAVGEDSVTCTHVWSAWSVMQQPTCGSEGLQTHTCQLCGATENEAIPATGNHNWEDWETTKNATVFSTGVATRECWDCSETETKEIPKVKAFAKFRKSSYTVTAGKTLALASTVGKGRGDSVKKWKSSNSSVATVSSSGKVKAKKKGTAKITVTLKSGKKATTKINVKAKKKAKKSGGGTVYWVDSGDVYHLSKNCRTLARSRNIHSGTIAQSGKSRACRVCG